MRRLVQGGAIDRTRPLRFWFDGVAYAGFAGDTLASALLGAGVDVLGTSVSFGRPRGIMAAGLEESTGFVEVVSGSVSEPLVRASSLPLVDGLVAEGGSRITRGYLRSGPDRARFDKRFAHADVLVIGAGPAGLAAAATAAASGADVMLLDAGGAVGGALRRDGEDVVVAALRAHLASVRVLTSTVASVALDQNGIIAVQRSPAGTRVAQRLWHLRARTVILATGMLERPIVFADNDRPGIMLAAAARSYLALHALVPERGTVFTTTDDGYRTALAWHAAGVDVVAIVDPRGPGDGHWRARAAAAGLRVLTEAVVEGTDADAQGRLAAIRVRHARGRLRLATDVLAVSGGWEPDLNLHVQRRGPTRYDAWWCAAVPAGALPGQELAGGANGRGDTASCLAEGVTAAQRALSALGVGPRDVPLPEVAPVLEDEPAQLWHVPSPDGDESRSFVDLHRDATVAGITRATASGLTHVEHIKRYTLIGTGVEQGRMAKINAGVIAAALTDRPVAEVGTSGSRPPVEPIAFHTLAGLSAGSMFDPVRTTSLHDQHRALGAVFESAGAWLRPTCYPRPFESMDAAIAREQRAVRTAVGLCDVSTLGKVDIQGPDATWFLDQVYAGRVTSIPVGQSRYALLCRMDGSVLDDGVLMRLGPDHWFATTSTGHAAAVVDWFEEWLQTEWPSRRVWVTPVTEQYATVAVAGPRAREALHGLVALDLSDAAVPFLGVRRSTIAGIPGGQVARVSFSGELAFELSVPWDRGPDLWAALLRAGAPCGIEPYGLEALQALRIEKGYAIVGQDTEGTTTPLDLGLDWLLDRRKAFVGCRSLERPALRATDRLQLVGIATWNGDEVVPEGAALTRRVHAPPMTIEGHVTSFRWSATLGRSLGLALVKGGRARYGETLYAPLGGRTVAVSIVDPVHYDPRGRRRDG